jgi:phosphatidylserine/phosphatidylglycerophosphate/cardiolipin synthase-like enzyme
VYTFLCQQGSGKWHDVSLTKAETRRIFTAYMLWRNAALKQWRLFMFELRESARKELEAYFADKERGDIRIYLAPGG